MKKNTLIILALIAFFLAVGCFSSGDDNQGDYSNDDTATTTAASCDANPAWFNTPMTEPRYDTFPGSNATNCDFHQISWQYFLWLTETVGNGELRFETMFNSEAIDPNYPDSTSHILGGIVQAGGPAGILIDQNGRAVYTTLLINDIYRDFVIQHNLYTVEGMKAVPDSLDFPPGAFSLKASWKIVEEGEDVSKFYTTTAEVKVLKQENGKIVLTEETKQEQVALVGFHIAVVVEHHPEFIWATFEHIDNAPNLDADANMNAPVSNNDYTFYAAGTLPGACNQFNASIVSLDAATQKMTPITQVFRQYRNGGGDSTNNSNIDSLNASVHSMLPTGSVWKNYREVGAVWFNTAKGVLVPNWTPNNDPQDRITGSTKVSNATIETFTQNIRSEHECFSCHNTLAVTNTFEPEKSLAGKNVLTSHILLQNYLDLVGGERISRVE